GFANFAKQAAAFSEVKRRTQELHEQLLSFLPRSIEIEMLPGEKKEDFQKRAKELLEKRTAELTREKEQGIWGPLSQEAYKRYQKWFYEKGLPGAMRELDYLVLKWPVGCPEQLKLGMAERAENPELVRALLTSGSRMLNQPEFNAAEALEDKAYKQLLHN